MSKLIFGTDRINDNVFCEDCPPTKRPIKKENAVFVNKWLDPNLPPVRHVYCKRHYASYCAKQAELPLFSPCGNTGVLSVNQGQE